MFGERVLGGEVLDQLDDLKPLAGCELQKGAQQAKTFDGTGRRRSELEMQLSREIEVFHLAPMQGSAPLPSAVEFSLQNQTQRRTP